MVQEHRSPWYRAVPIVIFIYFDLGTDISTLITYFFNNASPDGGVTDFLDIGPSWYFSLALAVMMLSSLLIGAYEVYITYPPDPGLGCIGGLLGAKAGWNP